MLTLTYNLIKDEEPEQENAFYGNPLSLVAEKLLHTHEQCEVTLSRIFALHEGILTIRLSRKDIHPDPKGGLYHEVGSCRRSHGFFNAPIGNYE